MRIRISCKYKHYPQAPELTERSKRLYCLTHPVWGLCLGYVLLGSGAFLFPESIAIPMTLMIIGVISESILMHRYRKRKIAQYDAEYMQLLQSWRIAFPSYKPAESDQGTDVKSTNSENDRNEAQRMLDKRIRIEQLQKLVEACEKQGCEMGEAVDRFYENVAMAAKGQNIEALSGMLEIREAIDGQCDKLYEVTEKLKGQAGWARVWYRCSFCKCSWEREGWEPFGKQELFCPRCGLDLLQDHTEEEIAEANRRVQDLMGRPPFKPFEP